ncbi:MAG: DUF362 domain-containing protein [Armatimonadetes bacterium]|nr:DUF362 domain-containing protein [Armatimonadota bacterium]
MARQTALANMVHLAVRDAVGAATPQQAWGKLFSRDDVVAVKVNCLAPEICPSQGIIMAIVQGLGAAGVSPDHIIIYDKEDRDLKKAGYTVRYEPPGPLCYGTIGDGSNPGYEPRFTLVHDTSFRLSKIVTRQATAIINVPVVKQHEYAGITGALKNHFGTIHNPEDFHKFACDPAIADVNQAMALRSKQRLIIVDATQVLYNGGPSYAPQYVVPYWAVFAGTDPVAVDTELLQLIEMCRKQQGLEPLSKQEYPPRHLQTAAKAGLGCGDLSEINLIVRNF